MGKDFRKIRPTTIQAEGYNKVFNSVWEKSIQYFRNEIFHKIRNQTFVGDLREAITAENTINYCSDVILNNLTLGPEWWDTFKSDILEASMKFQRKNISSKQYEFHHLQQRFFCLSHTDPEKGVINRKLNSLLKEINIKNYQKITK